MKVSELISRLREAENNYGDIEVKIGELDICEQYIYSSVTAIGIRTDIYESTKFIAIE